MMIIRINFNLMIVLLYSFRPKVQEHESEEDSRYVDIKMFSCDHILNSHNQVFSVCPSRMFYLQILITLFSLSLMNKQTSSLMNKQTCCLTV